MPPGLVVLAGLPGVGKSTLAVPLARELGAPYLRIDTVEQALVDSGELVGPPVTAGYRAACALARDQLRIGLTAVVECVNPLRATRDAWAEVAAQQGAWMLDVEVVCSDPREHRARVENRPVDVPGLRAPSWQQVLERHYEPWDRDRLVVDTAALGVEEAVAAIRDEVTGPVTTSAG